MQKRQNVKQYHFYQLLVTLALFCSRLLHLLTNLIIKIKLNEENSSENFVRITEYNSK